MSKINELASHDERLTNIPRKTVEKAIDAIEELMGWHNADVDAPPPDIEATLAELRALLTSQSRG